MENNSRQKTNTREGAAGPGLDDEGIGLDILDFQDNLPFYVMLVDEDHRILQANKAVRSQLGVERGDILGGYCPNVVHGVSDIFDGCPLEEAVASGGDKAVERELYDRGTKRWLLSGIYPTRAVTPDGKRIYFHMVSDITDRKLTEEKLKASNDRLRWLSAYLESVREEERKQIARDLHDETSQLIASLSAYIEAAMGKLPPGSGESQKLLQKARESSTQLMDEVHKLIYALRPTIIDDFGLIAALKWLTENSLQVSGIKVTFRVTGKEGNLSPDLKTAIFRVIQEATNNVLKHANARHVAVTIKSTRNNLALSFRDDGAGFDVDNIEYAKNKPRGLGLLNMKERIEQFDGTFSITSEKSKGTKISINVPLNNRIED